MNIGQKLGGGFGIILVLLLVGIATGSFALQTVTSSNQKVIDDMETIKFAVKKEVDHLAWMNDLGKKFITGKRFEGDWILPNAASDSGMTI